MTNVIETKLPSKADYKRYKIILAEIRADLDIVEQALFRLGRNLAAVQERRLYLCGGFASFAEFCQAELGKSRQQGYRLIQAHDMMQQLLESGIAQEELPPTERLCRELRSLGNVTPDETARVWKAVLRVKKTRGTPTTVVDVQEAAATELSSQSAIDRQQTELIQKFEGIGRSLKVGLKFDVLSSSFRLRLFAALNDIAETVTLLMASLRSPAIDGRIKEERPNQ